MSLDLFHPIVAQWFRDTLGTPTPAQAAGWAAIRRREHTLIAAPTGSGKTLAAFLTALDDLVREAEARTLHDEVRVVYVSPLKALSADIHKNLAEPRRGILRLAEDQGLAAPRITAAVRTGDTTPRERASMLRTPPHILVTTPESLYLLLTAGRSREMLRTVRTVIVDEIHAVIGTRRGAHLALTLERLQQVTECRLLRLGLSATQKPIDEVARFLAGRPDGEAAAPVTIVDEGHRRAMDVGVEMPASPLEAVMAHEVWEEYYDRLAELIVAHRTTLVFVNTRRMAERTARHLTDRLGEGAVDAHHGSLSKDTRLRAEARLKNGELKALVATASLELGIDIGHVDLVCQIGSPHRIATWLQRVGRSGHTIRGLPKGRVFPNSRDDLVECAAMLRAARRGELDAIVPNDAPLDVLAQQIVAESACAAYDEDALFALVRRAWPYRALARDEFDKVVAMLGDGFSTRRGRRSALVHRDEVNAAVRARRGSRLLALTSGGAIPEVADYRVVLDPDDVFLGTVNEDFAIESMAGDVFQLGNTSWRILQVAGGVVRVADAKGAPPTIPFWFGEAPARSDELSRAVSDLRRDVERLLSASPSSDLEAVILWIVEETGLARAAAEQIANYLAEAHRALGVLPTQQTLVLERFFDESGGMQLVLHAPFGSRINKAWGLALRKRFCRQFNFELQAAATEDALLLSLGTQHSFPLADVFRYLHPATAKDILVQAFLDAPVFETRWRWNATISLAVPRNRGGRKVPPQLQRMLADDLLAAAFPDAAACLENIPGDRQIPDHPLVSQTVRDCLQEAMDFEGLSALLSRIHAGDVQCVARDTVEPSPLTHEILTARPYAFLDDAPLEERRTQAVLARRASDPATRGDLGRLDPAAIARVRSEVRPDPRDADELHDALMTAGFLRGDEASSLPAEFFDVLVEARRAARVSVGHHGALVWCAAERLPELLAIHPAAVLDPRIAPPPSRTERVWTRDAAVTELLRGRMTLVGPTTAEALARELAVERREADAALASLEAEGVVLRGTFSPDGPAAAGEDAGPANADPRQAQVGPEHRQRAGHDTEWCDRRLLARIHRYTINRLRAEIEPVSPADFMRFLFVWQHVHPSAQLTGSDGLREVVSILDGYELAATAWERAVLPARMDRYDPALLDVLCLTGEVGWARLSPAPTRLTSNTAVALFLRAHHGLWLTLRAAAERDTAPPTPALGEAAQRVLDLLRTRGASFVQEVAAACALDESTVRHALGELAAAGLAASDGFAGLRDVVREGFAPPQARGPRPQSAGRWSLLTSPSDRPADGAYEHQAWTLLRRYGVVFRRVVALESNAAPWRVLAQIYRRLEARGEIRGGRFVSGMSGEQFALPDAVTRLREIRRTPSDGRLLTISAADPLNLTGIITSGERVRAVASSRIVYRDGQPLAALEGDYARQLGAVDPAIAADVTMALAGRPLPPTLSGFIGRA
jgi:ATP-dependent helicase Lhr and Lhr-like helicase